MFHGKANWSFVEPDVSPQTLPGPGPEPEPDPDPNPNPDPDPTDHGPRTTTVGLLKFSFYKVCARSRGHVPLVRLNRQVLDRGGLDVFSCMHPHMCSLQSQTLADLGARSLFLTGVVRFSLYLGGRVRGAVVTPTPPTPSTRFLKRC